MSLQGKRILLTGASGGIGQAVARRLAADGAELLLVGRRVDQLAALAATLPGRHHAIVADVSRDDDRQRLCGRIRQLGGLDMLINNAGVQHFGWLAAQGGEVIRAQIDINLVSAVLLVHDLMPQLLQAPAAVVLNIGSTFGSIGHPGFAAYCASKFGLRGFSEALQRELADTRARVVYLAPRATRTSLNSQEVEGLNADLGTKTDTPEQVAEAVRHALLHPATSRRFMGWPERFFVFLNQLLPVLVDAALRRQLPVIKRHARAKENTHDRFAA
ncbi:SDR family oxidoreductase [Amnimonas aquatica]|uniref:Short chain dehydrogenase n=1 Tax=Amnimonas aquatica TaxID=2094561 RepID=A0A2P6AQW8_9GAMM|nr:SDR family oxidoreductase [Amnimonas aquatica]PQA33132.1 short chain dehydrogenase [Amnimonas aquatica]